MSDVLHELADELRALGADDVEAGELLADLAGLQDLCEAPAPSPALAALLAGDDTVVPLPVSLPVSLPVRAATRAEHVGWARRSGTVTGALVVLVSGVGATGLSAAANTLPATLQDRVSSFSRDYLPFEFPATSARRDPEPLFAPRPDAEVPVGPAPTVLLPRPGDVPSRGATRGDLPWPGYVPGSAQGQTQGQTQGQAQGQGRPGRSGADVVSEPSEAPSPSPSSAPSTTPSATPSALPSSAPSAKPRATWSAAPRPRPTGPASPSVAPTVRPSYTAAPRPGRPVPKPGRPGAGAPTPPGFGEPVQPSPVPGGGASTGPTAVPAPDPRPEPGSSGTGQDGDPGGRTSPGLGGLLPDLPDLPDLLR